MYYNTKMKLWDDGEKKSERELVKEAEYGRTQVFIHFKISEREFSNCL